MLLSFHPSLVPPIKMADLTIRYCYLGGAYNKKKSGKRGTLSLGGLSRSHFVVRFPEPNNCIVTADLGPFPSRASSFTGWKRQPYPTNRAISRHIKNIRASKLQFCMKRDKCHNENSSEKSQVILSLRRNVSFNKILKS